MQRILHLRRSLVWLGLAAVLTGPPAALAEEESTVSTGVAGFAAGLCSMAYTPLKIAYAGSGLVVGGMSYLASAGHSPTSSRLIRRAVRGDYVLTPKQLRGQNRIHFFGS